jgi:hypothetical protein
LAPDPLAQALGLAQAISRAKAINRAKTKGLTTVCHF